MANKAIRKLKVNSTDVTGYKKVRSERVEVAVGRLLSTDYALDDILTFQEIAATQILSARFIPTGGTEVEVLNAASLTNPVQIPVGASTVNIDYVILFERGSGVTLRIKPVNTAS